MKILNERYSYEAYPFNLFVFVVGFCCCRFRLIDECGVAMYCDMHAHSRRHDIFIYGCENKRNSEKKLSEQVFPLMMHKNAADKVW